MTTLQSAAAAFAVGLAMLGPSAPATAAVRVCQALIVAGPFEAETEIAARKRAVDAWVARAATLGKGYTSWQLATDRAAQCGKAPAGGFTCAIRGRPCTIQQNPQRRPPPPPTGQIAT